MQKIVHSSAVESIDSITVLFSTLGNVSTRYPIGAVSGKLTEDSALNGTASRALGSWESSCVDSLFAVSSWSRLITANRHSVCAAWPAGRPAAGPLNCICRGDMVMIDYQYTVCQDLPDAPAPCLEPCAPDAADSSWHGSR